MSNTQKYLLDANVFISAYRQYYAFDIAPFFWDAIIRHAANHRIISINPVKQELQGFGEEDDLAKWSVNNFNDWFKPVDDANVLTAYAGLMQWSTNHEQYNPEAKAEFADAAIADAWLIAYAQANNCVLVTHEAHKPLCKRKIPIPNVCLEHGVQYVDTFEMLRELGIRSN